MLYPYELVDFGTQMLDLPVTLNHSNAGSNFVNAVMVVYGYAVSLLNNVGCC